MPDRQLKESLTPYLTGEKEAFATTLLSGLLKVYGTDLLNWSGETIQLEVKDDFGVEMPRVVYDQLMALLTALTTDEVYKDVPLFDEIVSALSRRGVGVEKGVPPVDDVAWAVAELQLNDPDPVTRDPDNPWSRDIQKYVRVVLDDEGLSIAPKVLSFAANRPVKKEGFDDPAVFAGAWGNAQSRADEVDAWAESQVVELLQQLADIGVQFTSEDQAEEPEEPGPQQKVSHAMNREAALMELDARLKRRVP